MSDDRERWALILGASSGMGEATALALARAGYRIVGVHLDFRAGLQHVEDIKRQIGEAGSEALYINMNAADDEKRAGAVAPIQERFAASRRGMAPTERASGPFWIRYSQSSPWGNVAVGVDSRHSRLHGQ